MWDISFGVYPDNLANPHLTLATGKHIKKKKNRGTRNKIEQTVGLPSLEIRISF